MSSQRRAEFAMVLVSLLWGITFPLIRAALEDIGPHQFVGWRFGLAVVAFLPLVTLHPEARAALRPALLPGLLLGLIAWTSYTSQTIGLQTVPAGRAAFITGLAVVLVPLLSPVFRAGRPTAIDVLAAGVATLGLFLLTDGAQPGAGIGVGDVWLLGCALSYAVYIHVLQKVLRRRHQELSLAFTQILGIFLAAMLPLMATGGLHIELTLAVFAALAVCALLATVGTFWLQTRYQGRTTPQRVALIFTLEPVFATGFAWWLLGETLGARGALGGVLVLVAVVGAEFLGARKTTTEIS